MGEYKLKAAQPWYISTKEACWMKCGASACGAGTCVSQRDTMDINAFYDRFSKGLERHPNTGAFGRWLNPLGRWDWWDLGGRFDGRIIGDQRPGTARSVAKVSSGANPGRIILANIENRLAEALGQEPFETLDVRTDQNIELVATLLEDARSNRANACPSSPRTTAWGRSKTVCDGSIRGRISGLKRHSPGWALSSQADWDAIVRAVYARFEDHLGGRDSLPPLNSETRRRNSSHKYSSASARSRIASTGPLRRTSPPRMT